MLDVKPRENIILYYYTNNNMLTFKKKGEQIVLQNLNLKAQKKKK